MSLHCEFEDINLTAYICIVRCCVNPRIICRDRMLMIGICIYMNRSHLREIIIRAKNFQQVSTTTAAYVLMVFHGQVKKTFFFFNSGDLAHLRTLFSLYIPSTTTSLSLYISCLVPLLVMITNLPKEEIVLSIRP